VELTLTDRGLNAGPGLGMAPMQLIFDYLSMLHSLGPQEWIWQESAGLSEAKFRNAPEPAASL
jgi:secreted Zn-dependent insulinase-like peptidase